MIFTIIGILSSLIFIAGDIPYFIDSIRKKTQPHRVTWGVIFLLNIIGFANQYAAGARNSLWLFGAAVLATGAIFLVSLFNGVGGKTKLDIISLVIALTGVLLWIIIEDPLVSIFANILAAMVGIYPTMRKSKLDPGSETVSAYFFGSISSFLAAISVGELNFQLLILPLFSTIVQAYLVYLISIRPKKLLAK